LYWISHLGGVGFDLMPAILAPHDQPLDARGGAAAEGRRRPPVSPRPPTSGALCPPDQSGLRASPPPHRREAKEAGAEQRDRRRLGYGDFGDHDLAVAGLEIGDQDLVRARVEGAAAIAGTVAPGAADAAAAAIAAATTGPAAPAAAEAAAL
jgi:hypothetical protein